MQIEPIHEAFVARVTGLDAAKPIEVQVQARLRGWHAEYPILVFEDQSMDAAQFVEFARIFGPIEIDHHLTQFADAGYPEIIYVTNVGADGKPDPASAERGSEWHADSTYKAEPCAHTMLYALEIPSTGGGTFFADMRRAFADLPAPLRAKVERLSARHQFGCGRAPGGVIPPTPEERASLPSVTHPVVRRHPETGSQALYVNPLHTTGIVGLAADESDALLDELLDRAVMPQYVHHHQWRVGQVVIWDQRCTLHRAEATYSMTERRRLMRAKIAEAT